MRVLRYIWRILTGCWYIVDSSGHGSKFVPGNWPLKKKMAVKEAKHWEGVADTIGGRAQVRNMFTGKIIPHY